MTMLDNHMLSRETDSRKLLLSDTLAPVLGPFAASLASCNAALQSRSSIRLHPLMLAMFFVT